MCFIMGKGSLLSEHMFKKAVVFRLCGEKILGIMHRTLKDNNLKVRALRRARELRGVSASLFFLAFFPFTAVHSTIKQPLSTIMVENQRR